MGTHGATKSHVKLLAVELHGDGTAGNWPLLGVCAVVTAFRAVSGSAPRAEATIYPGLRPDVAERSGSSPRRWPVRCLGALIPRGHDVTEPDDPIDAAAFGFTCWQNVFPGLVGASHGHSGRPGRHDTGVGPARLLAGGEPSGLRRRFPRWRGWIVAAICALVVADGAAAACTRWLGHVVLLSPCACRRRHRGDR